MSAKHPVKKKSVKGKLVEFHVAAVVTGVYSLEVNHFLNVEKGDPLWKKLKKAYDAVQ